VRASRCATSPFAPRLEAVVGALLAGGREDYENSHALLDSEGGVEILREQMLSDWVGISVLADRLVSDATVSGRDAWQLLDAGGGQP
jgi:hypothetical protein